MYKQKTQLEDISKLQEPIGQQLISIEDRLRETFSDQHDVLTAATEHLLDSGGKRVRPIVALLSASIFEALFLLQYYIREVKTTSAGTGT